MASWEYKFRLWAQPPSATENQRAENAITAIKNAVGRSYKLREKSIKTFVQGSFRNRVNVRQDSDVDVGVMLYDVFLSQYPEGMKDADFYVKDGGYSFPQFKNELGEALFDYFGAATVSRGNKAFHIEENTYHVKADVVPLFEFRQYWKDKTYRAGVALLTDSGKRIENYPERLVTYWPPTPLHYENGVAKNDATSRGFKGVVRILKKLKVEMEADNIQPAKEICGYLIECLVWNVPNVAFSRDGWEPRVRAVVASLWQELQSDEAVHEWCEVDDIKYLFRPSQQWNRQLAFDFVNAAWSYIGVTS